mmetsp:Transcript_120877/g.301615  ORF Transcript_120877/g.301615 Transcript_120877/m.301615 type:complete len:504 (+) Transcript_120877:60-1571(+)
MVTGLETPPARPVTFSPQSVQPPAKVDILSVRHPTRCPFPRFFSGVRLGPVAIGGFVGISTGRRWCRRHLHVRQRIGVAVGTPKDGAGASGEQFDGGIPENQEDEQVVTPWKVEAGKGGVDYNKLIDQFGCQAITPEQVDRIQRLTGRPPHRFLRRGLFFAHRDLDAILDAYEKGEAFYVYTGRGPSSESLHLGHMVPFLFTKWLQDAFDVQVVIEMTDDEKFLFKDQLGLEEARRLGFENARDIIAVGFDPAKTFIFRDTDYIRELYPVALQIQKCVTLRQAQNTFGFTGSDNIGKVAFPAIQASPSFALAFPRFLPPGARCLIPQAIDQDPYFRVTRGVAQKLSWPKPALIHAKFLPALQGNQTKMSASDESTALYMTDTEKQLRNKINKRAFSGGAATAEEQRLRGADLSADVCYQYLKIWLEDDEELARIGEAYAAGDMLTGEVKKRLGDVVAALVHEHQAARTHVDDAVVERFMDPSRVELANSDQMTTTLPTGKSSA